jgi:hypothetical protein
MCAVEKYFYRWAGLWFSEMWCHIILCVGIGVGEEHAVLSVLFHSEHKFLLPFMCLVWEHNKYTHIPSFEVLSIDYADFSFVSSSCNLCLSIFIFSLRTVSLLASCRTHVSVDIMVWFCLVYLFIHSVTHVTLDTSITDYNLFITTQLYYIWTSTQYNIINNNTKFKGQLEVESI